LARRVVLGGGVPLVASDRRKSYAARDDILPRSLLRSQCGRRSKDFRVLYPKKIRRGCRKKQVGVLKRRVFRQCHFLIRHHELYLLHSCSDFHDVNRYDYVANVANFWERSQIRSSWFSLIYLHCSKINQGEIYISFTNPQICNV